MLLVAVHMVRVFPRQSNRCGWWHYVFGVCVFGLPSRAVRLYMQCACVLASGIPGKEIHDQLECQTPKWRILAAILDFHHIGFMCVKSDDIFVFVTIKNLYNIPITEIYLGMFLCISGKNAFLQRILGVHFSGGMYRGVRGVQFLKFFLWCYFWLSYHVLNRVFWKSRLNYHPFSSVLSLVRQPKAGFSPNPKISYIVFFLCWLFIIRVYAIISRVPVVWTFHPWPILNFKMAYKMAAASLKHNTFFRELTYRSDPSTDFHAWWLKRRGLAQWCAFWGFRW